MILSLLKEEGVRSPSGILTSIAFIQIYICHNGIILLVSVAVVVYVNHVITSDSISVVRAAALLP